MKIKNAICVSVALFWVGLILVSSIEVRGQATDAQKPGEAGQAQGSQPTQVLSPIQQLEKILTPEQREKIRAIFRQSKEERETIKERVRGARQALNEAIESDNPDEALIEQRAHELAEAQGANIRLQALTEARIRQVLTPDQRVTLRELREQAQAARRQQLLEGKEQGPKGRPPRPDALQRRSTGPQIGPGSRGKTPQRLLKPR
jgi:Spy/CpxP family protein refolding chaperone